MTEQEYKQKRQDINSKITEIKETARIATTPFTEERNLLEQKYLNHLIKESGLKLNHQYMEGNTKVWIKEFKLCAYSYKLNIVTFKVKKDGTNGMAPCTSYGLTADRLKPLKG